MLALYGFRSEEAGMKRRQSVEQAGPLVLYAWGFQAELEGRGFAPTSVRFRLRQLNALSRWLYENHLTVNNLDATCVDQMVTDRRVKGRVTLVSVANFSLLLAYLRGIGVVPPEAAVADSVGVLLDRYRGYLVTERGLADGSIGVNMLVVERFCRDVAARHGRLEDLDAAEVTAYVVAVSTGSSVGWSKKTVTALAGFLRFLHVSGVTSRPLAAALPKVAGHRHRLPCELTDDDITRLLAGCDRQRVVGLRDHAIVTLLWRLGLRAGEVAGLSIDDIDWHRGELTIAGKGNRQKRLPIPADVGEAIVTYLRSGMRRVPPHCRALFVTVRAPEGAMTGTGVSDVVQRLAQRAGMASMGPHLLRHGAATELLRHGASWPEIAQVLRHRSLAVTASYATADPAATAELARPWPGAR
jgi:integrase/recombinase XerD